MRGKHNFLVFILHSFKQQMFRPSIDNTLCFTLTVTVTIYKVLCPKRLKIGVIKEQQRKKLKKRKKLGGKNFCVLRIFCDEKEQRLSLNLNLDYALAEIFCLRKFLLLQ